MTAMSSKDNSDSSKVGMCETFLKLFVDQIWGDMKIKTMFLSRRGDETVIHRATLNDILTCSWSRRRSEDLFYAPSGSK